MASEKFKYQLRQEARQWQEQGLISPEIYQELASRYRLDELDSASRDRFILIVLGLGFILLGLGVITFVAANWQVWSRTVKVVLLLSLFIVTNCGGFYLWRSPDERKSRLGQGLLLLGALTLGANIGLMSQMFHQTGAAYMLYFVWGLGVCGMAYGLRLTSLGLMAIILVAISYFTAILVTDSNDGSLMQIILQQMALVVALLFVPLAYYCRSRWLFRLSFVFIASSLGTNIFDYLLEIIDPSSRSLIPAFLFILVPGFLWSYRDNLLFSSSPVNFDSITRKLAVLYLGCVFYLYSFNLWEDNLSFVRTEKLVYFDRWSLFIEPVLFAIFSVWAWWKLGQRRTNNLPWRLDRYSTYIGGTLIFLFGLIWLNLAVTPIGIGGAIVFNLLLFSLAIILIDRSVTEGRRFNFWLGIILLALQIFSRMFEYNTGLIFKAIVLFICGVAAILAGLLFERYLSNQNYQS